MICIICDSTDKEATGRLFTSEKQAQLPSLAKPSKVLRMGVLHIRGKQCNVRTFLPHILPMPCNE